MCERCAKAVRQYWPDLPERDYGDLLIGATAFPFAPPTTIALQLKLMADRSGCDLGLALAIANEDLEAEMAQAAKAGSDDG